MQAVEVGQAPGEKRGESLVACLDKGFADRDLFALEASPAIYQRRGGNSPMPLDRDHQRLVLAWRDDDIPAETTGIRVDKIWVGSATHLDDASVSRSPSKATTFGDRLSHPGPQPRFDRGHRRKVAREPHLQAASDRNPAARGKDHLLDHPCRLHGTQPAHKNGRIGCQASDIEHGRVEPVAATTHEVMTEHDGLFTVDSQDELAQHTHVSYEEALGAECPDLPIVVGER